MLLLLVFHQRGLNWQIFDAERTAPTVRGWQGRSTKILWNHHLHTRASMEASKVDGSEQGGTDLQPYSGSTAASLFPFHIELRESGRNQRF